MKTVTGYRWRELTIGLTLLAPLVGACGSSSPASGTGGSGGSGPGGTAAGAGGTAGGGAGGATAGPGCSTSAAPTAALIADFSEADGAPVVFDEGVPGGIVASSSSTETPPPSPMVEQGAWAIDYYGTGGAETRLVQVGIYFSQPNAACVDAHTYSGIEFKIGGTIVGCTLQLVVGDSETTSNTDDPMRGGCTTGACLPASVPVTLAATPQVTKVAWSQLSGGAPSGPIDPTKLTSVAWQVTMPAVPDGGPAGCEAHFTLDDVEFY